MKALTALASKFEKLLARLPGTIRKPVEREWRPLKELFIQGRAPRILIMGEGANAFVPEVLCSTSSATETVGAPGTIEQDEGLWHTFRGRGSLQFAIADPEGRFARSVISDAAPDLFVLLAGEDIEPGSLAQLRELHRYAQDRWHMAAPIVAAGRHSVSLRDALEQQEPIRLSVAAVVPITNREVLLTAIANALPDVARLEFARASGERAVQREIAVTLTRSTSAVCAGIGAQPIPLADFPILTGLQLLMVAGIIHIAGRDWNMKMTREFLAALGINVGAGLIFREGARAAVKLLPGFGNAISGAVAGAGTLALGRAATAYFIEGLSLEDARNRLARSKRAKK